MTFAYENLRLGELAIIADMNKPYFEEFEEFLEHEGYTTLFGFISEPDSNKAESTILKFLNSDRQEAQLFDGIARPYSRDKAKWLFLGWLLRDAPAQRLQPMVAKIAGATMNQRKARLLTILRNNLLVSFPTAAHWNWYTLREVMIDRLEGSRRSIKGTLFEVIVRRVLQQVFEENGDEIVVSESQTSLGGETYDVTVSGAKGQILMPVKTRETMGGGHALLFTRDIHKAIQAAHQAQLNCIPVVIAESWGGNLKALDCERFIYIDKNPNQIGVVEQLLLDQVKELSDYVRQICL